MILNLNAHVILRQDAYADLYEDSRAELFDRSRATLYDCADAKLFDKSSATLLHDSSCLIDSPDVEVWLDDFSVAILTPQADPKKIHQVSLQTQIKFKEKANG